MDLRRDDPAHEQADVWKRFRQMQTYTDQIPDAFQYDEIVVVADGSRALFGLTGIDRHHPCRPIGFIASTRRPECVDRPTTHAHIR